MGGVCVCVCVCVGGQGRQNEFKRGVWGWTPSGMQGAEPLGGGLGGKKLASPFSKMKLEFVQQVDGTLITKKLSKSSCFFPFLFF